jgi:hypothetical protein
MDGNSFDIRDGYIKELDALFPEIFSQGKIDLEKLKLSLGEDLTTADERYVLGMPYSTDNDQLKTNTVLQMKLARQSPYVFTRDVGGDAGVEFETI